MATFNAIEHRTICGLIQGLDLGPARAALQMIEQETWGPAEASSIYLLYRDRVRPLVPHAVWQAIIAILRLHASIPINPCLDSERNGSQVDVRET